MLLEIPATARRQELLMLLDPGTAARADAILDANRLMLLEIPATAAPRSFCTDVTVQVQLPPHAFGNPGNCGCLFPTRRGNNGWPA